MLYSTQINVLHRIVAMHPALLGVRIHRNASASPLPSNDHFPILAFSWIMSQYIHSDTIHFLSHFIKFVRALLNKAWLTEIVCCKLEGCEFDF
jgi:hypothetical protein